MIVIYIVTNYRTLDVNGVEAYFKELSNELRLNTNFIMHYVWLNSIEKYDRFQQTVVGKSKQYFFPGKMNLNEINADSSSIKAFDFLVSEMKECRQKKIVQINLAQHYHFAQKLKDSTNCKILLINHCMLSRFTIVEDYKTFQQITKKDDAFFKQCEIYEKIIYDSVDHIITVSEFAKSVLINRYKISDHKISTVFNGLRIVQRNNFNKMDLRKKYGFSLTEKIILFAGNIRKHKGIFDLLSVFNKLVSKNSNIRLIIAGDGNLSELLSSITNHWSNITITGNLERSTLYDFYLLADIGVVPSYVEQCSYVAIEMMHSGLPIIVANVDGLKEIVPNDCGQKVRLILGRNAAQIDAKELQDSILYFLENENIARQYAIRALHYARKYLSVSKMTSETINVYEKLASERKIPHFFTNIPEKGPLVTILLYYCDTDMFINDSINSILKQTYTKFELLILGNNSVNITTHIINQYKDCRIFRVKGQQEGDIIYWLNRGIQTANGKYIMFINSGDIIDKFKIEKQMKFLEDKKNIDVSIVASDYYIINNFGSIVGLKQFPVSNYEIKATILFQKPFLQFSAMTRSEVMKRNRYSSKGNSKSAFDFKFWLIMSSKYKIASIPEFLFSNRFISSNQNENEKKGSIIKILALEFDELNLEYNNQEFELHVAIMLGLGKSYFNTPEKNTALKEWIRKVLFATQAKYRFSKQIFRSSYSYILETISGIN